MIDFEAARRARVRRALGWGLGSVVVVALWVLLYLFLGFDEPLTPDTRACLEPVAPPPDSRNMFLAVLGIDAPDGVRPQDVGAKVASRYERAIADHSASGEPVDFSFGDGALEGRDQIAALCDTTNGDCVARYLRDAARIDQLAQTNRHVLENYIELASIDGFAVTLTPSLDAPTPPARVLTLIQRLHHASLIVRAGRGEDEAVAGALIDDLNLARHLLTQTDHLIYKMTAAAMMVRALHSISEAADHWPAVAEAAADTPELLRPVGAQELSLASSLCAEFRLLSSVFLRPEQVVDMADKDGIGLGVLSVLAYKPNATVNLAFIDLHASLERLDALAPPEFAERFAEYLAVLEKSERPGVLDHVLTWPWNPIGHILVEVARPQYERWYTRLYDLEGLRRVVAMKLLARKHALGDDQLQQLVGDRIDGLGDPYYDQPLALDLERRTLGFRALSQHDRPSSTAGNDGASRVHGRFEVALPAPAR